MLTIRGQVPAILPFAATSAFALYLVDGWRRGGGTIELTGSRAGAIGGVLNYVVVGAAACADAIAVSALDGVIYGAAFAIAAVNAAAAFERLASLCTQARVTLAEGTEGRGPRSSP